MPKFRNKPRIIDAEQFTHKSNPPRGVLQGDGDPNRFYVVTIQGMRISVSLGEWIVVESDREHYYPIQDQEFQRMYDPCE